ncbi:MAG: hypothetical protein ACYTG0_05110 [Planctomycetota bacterium]|jgi:uncharacterized membrane protein
MPKVAVAVAALLIIQGVAFYVGTPSKSPTALIPAAVGLPILILGILAVRQTARKHAMHGAAAFALLGLLAAVWRIAARGVSWSAAGVSLLLMVVICGGFVALCVKSFLDARRRQAATANDAPD